MPTESVYQLYRFEALGGMGIALTNQLRYTEGKKYFDKAFEIAEQLPPLAHPMVGELYGHYGEALFRTGYLKEAKPLLEKGLQWNPACTPCQVTLPVLNASFNQPDYFKAQSQEIVRWADDKTVINVYLTPVPVGDSRHWNPAYLQLAQKAMDAWEHATRNQWTFHLVDTPEQSDTAIRWLHNAVVENGEAVSGYTEEASEDGYMLNRDIAISLDDEKGVPTTQDELYTTLLHELGHLLGLGQHSTNPADVMSPESISQVITARDIQTLKRIYEYEPDVTNPPQMSVAAYRAQYYQTHPRLNQL